MCYLYIYMYIYIYHPFDLLYSMTKAVPCSRCCPTQFHGVCIASVERLFRVCFASVCRGTLHKQEAQRSQRQRIFAEGLASRKSPQGVEKQPKLVDWDLQWVPQPLKPENAAANDSYDSEAWGNYSSSDQWLLNTVLWVGTQWLILCKSLYMRPNLLPGKLNIQDLEISWNQLSFRFWKHQARAVSFGLCSVCSPLGFGRARCRISASALYLNQHISEARWDTHGNPTEEWSALTA